MKKSHINVTEKQKRLPQKTPRKSFFMTELISRVLYTCVQPSSIFTANYSAVQAKSSATIGMGRAAPRKIETKGVASDRVYSKPMLP